MKVIFLDFDGVLNSERFVRACRESGVVIAPSRMLLLKHIVDKIGAKIVLTTSWREHWDREKTKCDSTGTKINEIFSDFNLEIFDKTPKVPAGREEEIRAWIKTHPDVQNFVVLDDMFLSADFLDGHFVKTSNYLDGLDESGANMAIEILND